MDWVTHVIVVQVNNYGQNDSNSKRPFTEHMFKVRRENSTPSSDYTLWICSEFSELLITLLYASVRASFMNLGVSEAGADQ